MRRLGLALVAVSAAACSGGEGLELSDAAKRGKGTYLSVCIACHNMDPSKDGALGPAIAGSSRELLAARVVRGEYPPGYTPKRDSAAMAAFPQLAEQIPDLYAYLTEAARTSP